MKELLLMLFFGKVILLTPEAIDITDQWQTLHLESPISAITGGAALQIQFDLSPSMSDKLKKSQNVWKTLEESLLIDGIEVVLYADKESVTLDQQSALISDFTFSREDCVIISVYSNVMPTNKDFYKLKIRSKHPLDNVVLYWKNYLH